VLGIAPAGASTGIDVSNYQHPNGAAIDWAAVKASGQSFVFVKATEGVNGATPAYTNPWFTNDWAGAGAAGLLRGAYHFARPALPTTDSALLQARNFVAVAGSMQGGADLPPVLDLEVNGGLAPADLAAWTQTWLSEVERLTGRRPMIYTGLSFWNTSMAGSTAFGAYRLWFARYVGGNSPGMLPNGFLTWTFWQQSSSGAVAGVPATVDLDNYCCPDANLAALAGPTPGNSNGGSPFGSADVTAGLPDGRITIGGWAIDPDVPGPIEIHVYIDGIGTDTGPTNVGRSDIAALYGQFGAQHGYAWTGTGYPPGVHQVCTFAINQAYGVNTLLTCQNVVVPGGRPIGSVDVAAGLPDGRIVVAGWTLDFDTAAPTPVNVYVDGHGYDIGLANQSRTDIAAVAPAWGPAHGYNAVLTGMTPGVHQVCVFALNIGIGTNTLLVCKDVVVPGGPPIGSVDVVAGQPGGQLLVAGWALDFDTAAPTPINVYVDGHGYDIGLANQSRADIAAVAPAWGPLHGFGTVLTGIAPGAHQVCTYAINIGIGSNRLLACRTTTVG
jgi:GH25 family lysozyme M1 (1,4-beta-N-acetylmuramidase)